MAGSLAAAVVALLAISIGLVVTHRDPARSTLTQPANRSVATSAAPAQTASTLRSPLSTPTTQGRSTTPPSTTTPPSSTTPKLALTGRVIAIDPGHNGSNFSDPSYINAPVFNGREQEACDTTGAETDGGYTEAMFNYQVAQNLTADLEAEGAKVVLTRTTNTGVGPCITQRAAIGNNAHADAAVSIHADGGPPTGRGFVVLEPVADGINNVIIPASQTLGADVRAAFLAGAVEPVSDYYGSAGLQPRDDLGGLNLSTVPKVLVECANMRNPTDAALLINPAWQAQVAAALAGAITQFLQTPA